MKKPYDFLASDKEPFIYVEKCVVCLKDGMLTTLSGKNGISVIAPSGVLVLMMGMGTSITHEATIFCGVNDIQIAFFRGGCNVHTVFQSGRYQNPESLMNQFKLANEKKLEIAKKLMTLRFKYLKEVHLLKDLNELNGFTEILLYEARWTKEIYKKMLGKRKSVVEFKRDFDGTDVINERLNILNNALYSVCTAIILSCNLSPSIGFIHGSSRRGGLTFDLADIFKTKIVLDIAFSEKQYTTKQILYMLSNRLKESNFEVVKSMISICLYIAGDETISLEKLV